MKLLVLPAVTVLVVLAIWVALFWNCSPDDTLCIVEDYTAENLHCQCSGHPLYR